MSVTTARDHWYCSWCGKTAWATKQGAQQAIVYIQNLPDRSHTVPTRSYPCPAGEGFHLTKTKRRKKR